MKKFLIIIGIFILIGLCSISTLYVIFNQKKVTYFESQPSKDYYMRLLAIEDESRNKDCVHVEVARIPVLDYVDLLYEINRIDDEEKNHLLKSYGLRDEYMQLSIDDLYHPIFKCDEE